MAGSDAASAPAAGTTAPAHRFWHNGIRLVPLPAMNRIVVVAAREFVETVKTRAFFFGAIMMPMLILGLVFGMEKFKGLTEHETIPPRRVAVVDATGRVFDALQEQVAAYNAEHAEAPFILEQVNPADLAPAPHAANGASASPQPIINDGPLRRRVESGELYAFILIPAGAIEGDAASTFGRKDNRFEVLRRFDSMLESAVHSVRFAAADPPVDRGYIQKLQRPVPLVALDVVTGEQTAGRNIADVLTPFAFMFLLFSGTFGISQGLLTSLIEEKGSRIIEVLLSAVSPLQLMTGKILGMVAVGALLMGMWSAAGYWTAQSRGMAYLVSTERISYVVLYFVPAFLLYSSILAAFGSACNTLKEAQAMTFPLSLMTVVPMLFWFQLSQNPNSTLAMVLSFIPPITPFVMILRVCADPSIPVWQVAATLALLWISVAFAIWASAKIFRVGVLMYGNPPGLKGLVTWVRQA